jgi:hypothetical protein
VDILTTALALERASLNYAETPHPGDVLENVSNYEMSEAEVLEMLAAWTEARQNGAAAYTNMGIKLGDAKGWSPTELALAEQKNESRLAIANLLNLDPFWVGASVTGHRLPSAVDEVFAVALAKLGADDPARGMGEGILS